MSQEFITQQLQSIDSILSNTEKLIEIPYQNFILYAISIGLILLILPLLQNNILFAFIVLVSIFSISAVLSHHYFKKYFEQKDKKFIYSDFMKLINTVEFFIILLASLISLYALSTNNLIIFYFIWLFSIGILSYLYGFFTQKNLTYFGHFLITIATLYLVAFLLELPLEFETIGLFLSFMCICVGLVFFAFMRDKSSNV